MEDSTLVNLRELHYKETTPKETVNRLKSILCNLGIETCEEWKDASSIGTYSLRVTFSGTEIGCNGKGVSKEYALASAYAELFERFQNNFLGNYQNKIGSFNNFETAPDEKILSAAELIDSDNSFMQDYYAKVGLLSSSAIEKVKTFRELHRIEYFVRGEEDAYTSIPFYSLRDEKQVFLTKNVYQLFYGSNGMCAGNTSAEALVQGISEIIERYVQKKIILEKPGLPDVPEEYIAKYPQSYEMFKRLSRNNGYEIRMKDCSFGGKYPVAALLIIEKNTGNYGLKLGCHPDFGIAMERTFTEASQGQDVLLYTKSSKVDFHNRNVDTSTNICNSFKVGLAQYPYQILDKNPTYNFCPVKDVSLLSNQEILTNWLNELQNDGYDILIRDVSNLGFPSYHVLIPGLSNIVDTDASIFRAYNTRFYVSSLIMDIKKINKETCKYVIAALEYFRDSVFENTLASYYVQVDKNALPGENINCGILYFQAMCYVILEDYRMAAAKMSSVWVQAKKMNEDENRGSSYLAMYYYCSAMEKLGNHQHAMEYIRLMFDSVICSEVEELFNDITNILTKQYPVIDIEVNNFDKYLEILKVAQVNNPIFQDDLGRLFCN